jgi:F-box-like
MSQTSTLPTSDSDNNVVANESNSKWNTLPPDLLVSIAQFIPDLDITDIHRVCRTCSAWRESVLLREQALCRTLERTSGTLKSIDVDTEWNISHDDIYGADVVGYTDDATEDEKLQWAFKRGLHNHPIVHWRSAEDSAIGEWRINQLPETHKLKQTTSPEQRLIFQPMLEVWQNYVVHSPTQFTQSRYTLEFWRDLYWAGRFARRVQMCDIEWLFGNEATGSQSGILVEWDAKQPFDARLMAEKLNCVLPDATVLDEEEIFDCQIAAEFVSWAFWPSEAYGKKMIDNYIEQAEEDEEFRDNWCWVRDLVELAQLKDLRCVSLTGTDYEPDPVLYIGQRPSGNWIGILFGVGWSCG